MILIIFFLFCVISLIAILEDRLGEEVRTPLFFAVGLILAFVAGLRPSDLDHDYMSYVSLYYRKEAEFTTEISFVFIANFVYYVLGNVVFVFLIYAFLSLALHMKAIRRLTSLWFLSLLMYFCNYYLLHGMNQISVCRIVFMCNTVSEERGSLALSVAGILCFIVSLYFCNSFAFGRIRIFPFQEMAVLLLSFHHTALLSFIFVAYKSVDGDTDTLY